MYLMAIVTVVIDDDILKKLRVLQSKKISSSMKTVSFSKIVNDVLKKGLRKN